MTMDEGYYVNKIINPNVLAMYRLMKRDPEVRKSTLCLSATDQYILRDLIDAGIFWMGHGVTESGLGTYRKYGLTKRGDRLLSSLNDIAVELGADERIEDLVRRHTETMLERRHRAKVADRIRREEYKEKSKEDIDLDVFGNPIERW